MRLSAPLLLRNVVTVALLGTTSLIHATENDSYVSAMRYVSLDASSDNADSRQYSGTGSFTLGRYMWLQGNAGKLTDSSNDTVDTLGDLKNYGAGIGLKNEHLQLQLNFSSYKNDDGYKQRDVTTALDWNTERFSVGVDGFHRNTNSSVDIASPIQAGPSTLHGDASQTGNGIGLHATLNLTDALSVSAGGMSYSYDDIEVTTNIPPIATQLQRFQIVQNFVNKIRQVVQRQATSGLTRSLAVLDSSYNLGVSYQLNVVGLNAQYMRDEALDTGDTSDTFTLGAAFFLGDHWMLSPMIGQSKSDTADSVTFGGLSVSYNW
jgi:hypothetical protein